MACGKYGLNSPERAKWEVRSKMASAIFDGKSLEEVATDFEMTIEDVKAEIEAIKAENPEAYNVVMAALKNNGNA